MLLLHTRVLLSTWNAVALRPCSTTWGKGGMAHVMPLETCPKTKTWKADHEATGLDPKPAACRTRRHGT